MPSRFEILTGSVPPEMPDNAPAKDASEPQTMDLCSKALLCLEIAKAFHPNATEDELENHAVALMRFTVGRLHNMKATLRLPVSEGQVPIYGIHDMFSFGGTQTMGYNPPLRGQTA